MDGSATIGILGLQGDFEAHRNALSNLGCGAMIVRRAEELDGLSGLILPGGESTTLLKLLSPKFRSKIKEQVAAGMAVFATCAGAILAARTVSNPAQDSLDLIDIKVERNAYGRQAESFTAPNLDWTEEGHAEFQSAGISAYDQQSAVFIRAPKIAAVGSGVQVLARYKGSPVLVSKGRVTVATFHPEIMTGTQKLLQDKSRRSQIHAFFSVHCSLNQREV